MNLDETLKNVAVIGAAGKMGRGIAVLLLQQIAKLEAETTGTVGSGDYMLTLIDANGRLLHDLHPYLTEQLTRYAEKNITALRGYFVDNPSLVSNMEVVDAFVSGALSLTYFDKAISRAKKSSLVFEAIPEDVELKKSVLSQLSKECDEGAYFFSNTSSIPISELADSSGLQGRIIGFHFYNPPPVQKLLEIITPAGVSAELVALSQELAERLGKIVVASHDVAGFIGNGHLCREVCSVCRRAEELSQEMPLTEAVYTLNRVTGEYLVRPMGLFQLIDYVGLDVAAAIATTMSDRLGISLQAKVIATLLEKGLRGGQCADGSQKPGFFEYDKRQPVAIYDFAADGYVPLASAPWKGDADERLGPLPEGYASWKELTGIKDRHERLQAHFDDLAASGTFGAKLALEFLSESDKIVSALVTDGVAASLDDVHTVLTCGFYHLYTPDIVRSLGHASL